MAAMEETAGREGLSTEILPLHIVSLYRGQSSMRNCPDVWQMLSEQEIHVVCVKLLRFCIL